MERGTLVFIIIYLVLNLGAVAQDGTCGTEMTVESREFMDRISSRLDISSGDGLRVNQSRPLIEIPIRFHTVITSDGQGGLTESQFNEAINRLNDFYLPSNIQFFHVGVGGEFTGENLYSDVNVIVDDELYDYDTSEEGKVAVGNDIRGVINVYWLGRMNSNGLGLCGYTYFPPSADRIFMNYNCFGGLTLEHEFGHYFTLFHTHGTTNTGTTDELVDGSNCTVAGDRICDTPADPNLSGQVDNCQYVGNLVDANGDAYRPDVSNIMSYAPGSCRSTFSMGQYERIRRGFENGRDYLDFRSDSFVATFTTSQNRVCVGDQVKFSATALGQADFFWEFAGGTPSTSEDAAPLVTYDRGGSFTVKLTATNSAGEVFVVEKRNEVVVNDPQLNSIRDISSTIDTSIPNQLSIVNKDLGFSFEFNPDVDRDGDVASGSIYVNNYDYFVESLPSVDELNSRYFENGGVRAFNVSFDYAYAYRQAFVDNSIILVYDTLELSIEKGCGAEAEVIWKKGGNELQTGGGIEEKFVPSSSGQWAKATVNLPIDPNNFSHTRFRFTNYSYNGNNLYIDNLQIEPDYSVEAPFDLRLTSTSEGPILRWIDNSINELNFVVEGSVDGGDYQVIETLPPNTQRYSLKNLPESGNWTFRVFAQGYESNRSNYTAEVSFSYNVLSLVDDESKLKIDITPNPVSSQDLKIMVTGDFTGEYHYKIYNISGREISHGMVMKNSVEQEIRPVLGRIENGLIFADIILPDGQKVTKKILIKN